jgi:hypothetical protein
MTEATQDQSQFRAKIKERVLLQIKALEVAWIGWEVPIILQDRPSICVAIVHPVFFWIGYTATYAMYCHVG